MAGQSSLVLRPGRIERTGKDGLEILDTLQNLAEVGVAITGFAGIVAAVAHSSSGGWSERDSRNFVALVRWSLGATFLAYLPVLIFSLDGRVPAPWRVSNAVFATFHGYVFLQTFRGVRGGHMKLDRTAIALLSIGALVMSAEVAAAAGPLASIAPSVYLTATVWFLFIAAQRFLTLVTSHFSSHAG